MELFFTVFAAVFLAEMGDKTQLVTLLMSACRFPIHVFLGAVTGLALVTAIGVSLGRIIMSIFPSELTAAASALLFLAIGGYTIFNHFRLSDEREVDKEVKCGRNAFAKTFAMIFLAEMGDKTQFTAMSLAAISGRPLLVFAGAMSAQAINHGLAALLGGRLLSRLPRRHLRLASGIVFVLLGIVVLLFNIF